jgi:hypothetical protein
VPLAVRGMLWWVVAAWPLALLALAPGAWRRRRRGRGRPCVRGGTGTDALNYPPRHPTGVSASAYSCALRCANVTTFLTNTNPSRWPGPPTGSLTFCAPYFAAAYTFCPRVWYYNATYSFDVARMDDFAKARPHPYTPPTHWHTHTHRHTWACARPTRACTCTQQGLPPPNTHTHTHATTATATLLVLWLNWAAAGCRRRVCVCELRTHTSPCAGLL